MLVACVAAGGPGSAACAAPELAVTPTKTAPGGRILITGTAFQDGCNDSFVNGRSLDPPAKPLQNLTISLVQGARTWRLATVDAKPDSTFTVSSTVPADVSPGNAEVHATAGNLRAASLASEAQLEVT